MFSEQISTRIKIRPELEASALVTEIKTAAAPQPVILCVHEMKRLARNAAELMALSATLQTRDVALELLTGPMPGIYNPPGMGSLLFAVLAVAAQLDRDYIREKTLEGQAAAAARGKPRWRPPIIDDDMLVFACALRARGIPMPRDRREAHHRHRQERRHPPVGGLALPRTGQRRRPATAELTGLNPRHATQSHPGRPGRIAAGQRISARSFFIATATRHAAGIGHVTRPVAAGTDGTR